MRVQHRTAAGARGGTRRSRCIDLEFDQSRIVINQATLRVDGDVVDSARIFYGDKQLRTTLDDGTDVVVAVHSGMVGELTRAQLKRADGSWLDLAER
jgi:hypothetical protein